jgi:hypothetical protein
MRDSSHTSYHGVEEAGNGAVDGSGGSGDVVGADIVAWSCAEKEKG